jgi:sigma-E factor negative regulatory protein RseC
MIETRAQVVRAADGRLRMRGQAPAACGACQVRGACAGNHDALDIEPAADFCAGQSVILSVREADLLRASFYAYGVPSLSLVAGALTGALHGDFAAIAGALLGLCVGLGLTRLLGSRQPLLVRQQLDDSHPDNGDQP